MATLLMNDFDDYDVIKAQERIWGPRPVTTVEDYYGGANSGRPGLNRQQRRANAAVARKAKK